MRRIFLFALLAALTATATAQVRPSSSAHFASPLRPAVPVPTITGTARPDFAAFRSGPHRPLFYPFGALADFYANDFASSGYPVAAQPPLIMMQAPPLLGEPREEPQPPAQALIIELHGDHYVRVSDADSADGALAYQEPTASTLPRDSAKTKLKTAGPRSSASSFSAAPSSAQTPAARDLAPAVLIFRDGHSEEVRDYTIADGALYARGDYYTDGYWNKKIELSALNLSETLKSNQARGIRFVLPSAPNEVVTRP